MVIKLLGRSSYLGIGFYKSVKNLYDKKTINLRNINQIKINKINFTET